MAWYTEQIFSDFLNRSKEHEKVKNTLRKIFDDNVKLSIGNSIYMGIGDVVNYLEEVSHAIHNENGFIAKPVIITETEDKEFDLKMDCLYKAVALHSKLEDYISWFFMLKCNDNWKIETIKASRGNGYRYYFDMYEEGNYDYEEE